MSVCQQKEGSCAVIDQSYFSSMTGLASKKQKNKKITKSNLSTFIQCHAHPNNPINIDKIAQKASKNDSDHICNLNSNQFIQKCNNDQNIQQKKQYSRKQTSFQEQFEIKIQQQQQETIKLPFADLIQQQILKNVHQFKIESYKRYKKCKILKTQVKQRKFSGPDGMTKKFKYL